MAALLHEKPFSGVNGSGKHNNWSIDTDRGVNLFKAGSTAEEQRRFMVFITAVVAGFARNADLVRLSVATPGNDHRLGGCEAPPGIMSVYPGRQLGEHIDRIISGGSVSGYKGQHVLRDLNIDPYEPQAVPAEDRNRTSPFPFVGNRFEFRAVGSSQSVGLPQTMLAIVAADGCCVLADEIEKRISNGSSAEAAVDGVVRDMLKKYQHIMFNGNGYSAEWQEEAGKRGLLNINNSVDAIKLYSSAKNKLLLKELRVLQPHEIHARQEIMLEQYTRLMVMEARLAVQMTTQHVLPAIARAMALDASNCIAAAPLRAVVEELNQQLHQLNDMHSVQAAEFARDVVVPTAGRLRALVDAVEPLIPHGMWTLPTYEQMLHSSRY